jgi:hypothetical protein
VDIQSQKTEQNRHYSDPGMENQVGEVLQEQTEVVVAGYSFGQ